MFNTYKEKRQNARTDSRTVLTFIAESKNLHKISLYTTSLDQTLCRTAFDVKQGSHQTQRLLTVLLILNSVATVIHLLLLSLSCLVIAQLGLFGAV